MTEPRVIQCLILVVMSTALAGCGRLKFPQLPHRLITPTTSVTDVRLVASGNQAARFDIDVTLENPNDVALPLTNAMYRLNVSGISFSGQSLPLRTLPASGQVTVTLPAVLGGQSPAPPTSGSYETSGRITLTPPGQVRQFFYELGFPKPKASFSGRGQVGLSP